MARKYLRDLEDDSTPFEESLEKWLNSLSEEEEREAFLNEDWSELEEGKTSNNIDEANKVCGLCKHFLGMGDYNLCCDKQYDLTYTFSKPCDMFEGK